MSIPSLVEPFSGANSGFVSESADETLELGYRWGQQLVPPAVLLLSGGLGTGKTVLVRGIARGLGVLQEQRISSPTFTLVNSYQGRCPVHHVDLYRLESLQDFYSIGLFELIADPGVTLIEWGERVRPWIERGIEIEIEDLGGDRRLIHSRVFGPTTHSFASE